MGCDIHFYVKTKQGGAWQHHSWRAEHQTGEYEDRSPKYDYDKYFEDPFYVGRNYDLFAVLADVRNGFGFAGCDTGDRLVPISEPKGLPEDVSEGVKKESDRWGVDGHSHSWFTLKELLDYNWSRTMVKRGWVTQDEYKEFKEKGEPQSWSSWAGGRGVIHISNAEMDDLLQGKYPDYNENISYYTNIEWRAEYLDYLRHFLTTTIPAMQKLGNPEDVRAVFWFDN